MPVARGGDKRPRVQWLHGDIRGPSAILPSMGILIGTEEAGYGPRD